jgi:hypothetical protein
MLRISDRDRVRNYLRRRHPHSQTAKEIVDAASLGQKVDVLDATRATLRELVAEGLVETWSEPLEGMKTKGLEIRLYRATARLLAEAPRAVEEVFVVLPAKGARR